ncbi:(E,E)-geranyllinalool synthase-like [Prosopis cineraria]|uniref:(E,E)-geranyllinalool synthase-like n=1 Tax=Prosopis cineraria TaxID=364024 RepID=UPI00240F458A|nr:(E,E)-geranyllinalool synthase-like [Prosopis cineraria]
MDSTLSSITRRAQKIKGMMFSPDVDPYSFVSPSAYDTAWLAMIPDSCSEPDHYLQPKFRNCLNWLLHNQKEQGFWGQCDAHGNPTIEALPATLASIVSLKMWNTGPLLVQKGLSFIESNAEKLLKGMKEHCTPSLAIVLPGMLELAVTNGLHLLFPESVKETLSYIFSCREKFLNKDSLVGQHCYPPLLSYLEALPPSFAITTEDISCNLNSDGSLFQSPSATAKAFVVTGKQECLVYLESLAKRCPSGVPQTYPLDEDLIKLCVMNQLEKLGLSRYFAGEIEETMAQIYGNFIDRKSWAKPYNMIALQLHKDSLAFQLLRMQGYKVSPSSFCWFIRDKEIRGYVEKHPQCFTSALINVYGATNVMFCGEYQLEEARSFVGKLLEKMTSGDRDHQSQIGHELNLPWLARLEHLEHRMWIEEKEANALWKGKTSYNRISCLCNDELLQLAVQNYEFRQSLYKNELEELKRWSEDLGLRSMGFGREKTTYCYYAVAAAASSLPHDSHARMLAAKSAIVITVADDFFDMKASLPQLDDLMDAIGRWDGGGLSSHSKVIFDALDDLVSEAAERYPQQKGADITSNLRHLWHETFLSWLEEAKWSRNGQTPSIDEYLKIGMISIAAHTMVLPASCFLKPSLPIDMLRPPHYETITKLLMVICRLLNDIQSCQKEEQEGKVNSILTNLIENPELDMEDSIAFVREIIGKKKKEFMEHVLMDEMCDWPKPSKQFHLSCLKAFQMFYNSSNRYDSKTDLLEDIEKAIYLPLSRSLKKHLKVNDGVIAGLNKKYARINSNTKRYIKPKCLINVAVNNPQYTLRNVIHGVAPKIVGGFV